MKPQPQQPAEPHDPLDQVLGRFFKSEVPARWPTAPIPSQPQIRHQPRPNSSRWVLAASVALFLGLGLTMTSSPRQSSPAGPERTVDVNQATAQGKQFPVTPNTGR